VIQNEGKNQEVEIRDNASRLSEPEIPVYREKQESASGGLPSTIIIIFL
jgi:hypothetical protein